MNAAPLAANRRRPIKEGRFPNRPQRRFVNRRSLVSPWRDHPRLGRFLKSQHFRITSDQIWDCTRVNDRMTFHQEVRKQKHRRKP